MSRAPRRSLRLGIVGGGWAGLAAADRAVRLGHEVFLYEASRHWGGRARLLKFAKGPKETLDNGQHILIGAYTETLSLMQQVGVDVAQVLHPTSLNLRFADGGGLATPAWAAAWPTPLDVVAAIATALGWAWHDKLALLRTTTQWRTGGFTCPPEWNVARLCQNLPPRVLQDMVDPLCVAALNTPMDRASATVFLRVLQDAMLGQGWGQYKASTLLLPRADLGALLPRPASDWLVKHGAQCRTGTRIKALHRVGAHWRLEGAGVNEHFDHVILACPPAEAARLAQTCEVTGQSTAPWCQQALALRHEPIATVYLQAPADWAWPGTEPMLALRGGPAQFAFNRAALGGSPGLLALVVSACQGDKEALEQAIQQQAAQQLRLPHSQVMQTVVEKRATFACTPNLQRPGSAIAPGLWAAGEYIAGPYPGTLESAVRSGLQVAESISQT